MALIEREAVLKILHENPMGTWRGIPMYSEEIKAAIYEIGDLPTIDAIRAAGGCYCMECKYRESIEGSNDYCVIHETFCSKFCGDGKPMEARDDE